MPSPLIGVFMKRHSWIIAGLLCMLGLHAVTRIVDITGAGQYTSIQTAVTESSPGDTVLVYPGRYFENVTIRCGSISLISMEAVTGDTTYISITTIDGGLISSGLWVSENIQNVKVRGFTIN